MEECNICGNKNANRRARIEGVILTVCNNCVKLGEEMPAVRITPVKKIQLQEIKTVLVSDFHKIIRRNRENRGMTQQELAKRLNEKASIIKRIEEGWEPSMVLVKRLEKFFNIELIEEIQKKNVSEKQEQERLTIGDVIEVH